ncbi:peptide-methionine (S)-S-oxide reductase MsrA [Hyphobacterium marinum]|uniref:Peptide methionine sulfoxide reductase MsrA n=1 Tax=Hyphobacterium marinum TaxID=3116574 RepID=A0ABU7LUA0_9PROT|nr:peptide-methionine (S)-S-oxide reductase MsrA [Hyphobacterium sp. Y6023]MEE2565136.1 peptide-methionine (S)-S-oxide reductase MsrA [Hyphobacterium sp. Y6023]
MAWFDKAWKTNPVPAGDALPGRDTPILDPQPHFVSGASLTEIPAGHEVLDLGMGCFWGAERLFWEIPGVTSTSVGYGGGYTKNPTYSEVCTGATGHAELVRVIFDPAKVPLEELLKAFWENHDPTQGMRQGNDVGTQYRSALYWRDEDQKRRIEASRDAYQKALDAAGRGAITTEMAEAGPYYLAEDDHQQYLAKNPGGYCGLDGTGVSCPIGRGVPA